MAPLKPISREAIPAALDRADRYRLLNQPEQARSICLDVLRADPGNHAALTTLILAITDQFDRAESASLLMAARELLPRLTDEYERLYHEGVILERWGRALLFRRAPAPVVLEWIRQAMECFEKAESRSPVANDESILRWNACARLIEEWEEAARGEPPAPPEFDDDGDAPPL